jgi:hypothetical protein
MSYSKVSSKVSEHANREFLRAYGAFNDDGNSAQRAATALKEIIQEIPKK